MDDGTRELAIRNEMRICNLEKNILEIRADIDVIRDNVYHIRNNELKHYKNGTSFWLKFLGAGAGGAIILKVLELLYLYLNKIW